MFEQFLRVGLLLGNDAGVELVHALVRPGRARREAVARVERARHVQVHVHVDAALLELRDQVVRTYKEVLGKEPKVLSIHAGLECGILSQKIEGLDCVSFGPNIDDIHTTKEKLSISSTQRIWELLKKLMQM